VTFSTVADAIAKAGQVAPERGFTFQDVRGNERKYGFVEIEQRTAKIAYGLQQAGLRKGDRMGLIVIEPEEFVLTFLAAVRVGVLPVPLYPPLSLGSLDAYAERTAKVLQSAEAKLLVASGQLQNVLWSLVGTVPSLQRLVKCEELSEVAGTPDYPTITSSDLCFLQYTSGSTADPKGVMVTHANLVANCAAIQKGINVDGRVDTGVTWLPLYHDMGLIGCMLTPILHQIPMVYIPTLRFIKKPTCWMDALHAHKGTMTFGPNFAYALAAKKAKPEDLARWDLSHVKVFGCGAEPIHAATAREFMKVFASCGVKEGVFTPAYGLAEATLAVTFKPLGDAWRARVDADVEFVSCGRPLDQIELSIRSEEGGELAAGAEGEVWIRGPHVTPGYWKNPEATAATITKDGWLRTGDLGVLHDGELYVTGRIKDLVILNGRNLHPQAIEWAAAGVEGVRKGNVVAFSRPGAHSEELVVALEARSEDSAALEAAVKSAIQKELSVTVSDVVVLEPGALPKTSSGKLQRRKTRELYLSGELGAHGSRLPGATADRITLARHVAKSMWSRAKAAVLWR
jgi:fatty-acyl-CoA synthase